MSNVIDKTAAEQGEKSRKPSAKRVTIFKGTAGDFLKVLTKLSGATSRSRALPIVSHVLLDVKAGELRLVATDLEQQLEVTSGLGGAGATGQATANLRKLTDIIKALPPEVAMSMVSDGQTSSITAGRSKFKVGSLEAETFPITQRQVAKSTLTMSAPSLLSMVERVRHAISPNDLRPYLTGMLLAVNGKSVAGVGTDGHRLALMQAELTAEGGEISIIVPARAVDEIAKLLHGVEGNVSLSLGENQLHITVGDTSLTTKLIEGKFPDYTRVIPAMIEHSVTMERAQFCAALNQAAQITSQKFKGVRMCFDNNELQLSCENSDGEQSTCAFGIDYEGEKLELGVNVEYMRSCVESMTGDTVTLGLRGGQDSILITDQARREFRSVLMPMRI